MAEIVETNLATKQDLKDLEYRLTIKMGTIITIAVATICTVIKLF